MRRGRKERSGDSPLFDAAKQGSSRLVSQLLRSGAEAAATDSFGRTALFYAAVGPWLFKPLSDDRRQSLRLLLSARCCAGCKDLRGLSVADYVGEILYPFPGPSELSHSCKHPRLETRASEPLVQLLVCCSRADAADAFLSLEEEISLSEEMLWAKDPLTHETSLHVAATGGCKEAVAILLARKCSPDVQDAFGRTPLHLAASGGQSACCEKLLDRWPAQKSHSSIAKVHCRLDLITQVDIRGRTARAAARPRLGSIANMLLERELLLRDEASALKAKPPPASTICEDKAEVCMKNIHSDKRKADCLSAEDSERTSKVTEACLGPAQASPGGRRRYKIRLQRLYTDPDAGKKVPTAKEIIARMLEMCPESSRYFDRDLDGTA
eukprot:TRINITY_DN96160_c0_g1_i1.p1 TRINITY_DN96160_c0_g1~~TRINITY_DN96160_c0_g1_i1.p1  ORF type:complete len:382 (-),score=67.48 TRINITY_DN96160_c0_g1_i1:82-1227(-)